MARKKIYSLIFAIVIFLAFASCKARGNSNGGGDNEGVTSSGVIYSTEVETSIVKPDGDSSLNLQAVYERLYALTGNFNTTIVDSISKTGSEIVFGNTNRPVSGKAITALEKKIALATRNSEDSNEPIDDFIGYAVYSDGESVAIVWSDDYAAEMAVSDFIEKFLVSDKLELQAGYIYTNIFSRIQHKKSVEQAEREEMFKEIEAELGAEATKALRQYYEMFDERYYLWMANLYDPGEYDENGNPIGGGYYFSNSGRDTAGYGIDLESTHQALQLLSSTGMLVNYGDDFGAALREVLPEKMQKEIVAFVQSLQSSEDGYFYHPQWEAVSISRRGRDLDWATKLLGYFGAFPLWNTPNGVKGTLGAPGTSAVSHLTGRLSSSAVKAVSVVVPTSGSTLPVELRSLSNFKEYLDGKTSSMATSSYSIGNEIGAISSQILACGEDYVKAFEEWANALQNPENGLWESGVYYNSINGLMKLSGTYNSLGLKINYAEKALESALTMILHDGEDSKGKEAKNSVDVWNPFCAITNLLTNIDEYGDKRVSAAFLEKTQGTALDIIKVTTSKNAKFKKLDGSFGYSWGATSGTSQGSPVAVAGTDEGDINGGNIAVTGVSNYLCRILGIDVIPIYYPTDLEIYLKTIKELNPVLKDDVVLEVEPIHFDEDIVGGAPNKISSQVGTGSITVIEDPRDGSEGNVLEFITKKGVYSAIGINPTASKYNSCYVLDFDVCFAEVVESRVLFQVKMGKSYMFTMGVQNGKVVLGDASSTDGKISVAQNFGSFFDLGEWGNIRVEYYPSDDEAEVRVKLYVNGQLVVISDNYVGHPQSGVGEPVRGYDSIEFYGLQNSDMTVYFDNIDIRKIDKTYDTSDGTALVKWFVTNSEYENDFGYLGTGKYAGNEKTDGYDSSYSGLIGDSATAAVIKEGTNDILRVTKTSAGSAVASFLRTKMGGSVYVAETDFKWNASTLTEALTCFKMYLASSTYKNGGAPITELLGVGNPNGTLSIVLGEESLVTLSKNRWYSLRVEIVPSYKDDSRFTLKLFVDGTNVATKTLTVSDGISLAEYYGFEIELCEGASGYSIDLDNTYKGVAVTTAHPDIEYAYASPYKFDSTLGDDKYVVTKVNQSDISLADDPTSAVNKVLKAYYPSGSASEYSGTTVIKNSSANSGADAVYSSFAAKVYFETNGDTTAGRVARLIFKDNSYAFGLDVYVIYNSKDSSYSLKITHYNVGTGGVGSMNTIFDGVSVIDRWFDLRIDYCKSGHSSVMSIYVNGTCYAEDVVGYYYADKILNAGAVKEVEWRYIRSGVTTYLDDVAFECQVGNATLYEEEETTEEPENPTDPDDPGTGDQPTDPSNPDTGDEPTDPDDGLGGTENPDKDGTNKEDSMPDGGWVEEES